jgi:hypothetical protein
MPILLDLVAKLQTKEQGETAAGAYLGGSSKYSKAKTFQFDR